MNQGFAMAAVAGVLRWQATRLVLAAGMAVAAGLGGGGAQAAAVPSARSGTSPAVISGLSCKGGSFCLATGFYHKPGHPDIALAEAWNGRAWRFFPKPRYYDNNDPITCGGPSFCLAVTLPPGTSQSRAVAWNGRAWRAFTPQPPDQFDLMCPAARFCLTWDSSQIVAWNGGKSWRPMPGAGFSCAGPDCTFTFVSCSTATICADEGLYCTDDNCDSEVDFTEYWNGTIWGQDGFNPGPDGACAGRSFCMNLNLGPTSATAAVSRDWGTTWHDASAGLAAACHRTGCGRLWGLACGSPWFCVALTSKYQAARPAGALTWNGTTWTTERLARAAGRIPALTQLSCGSRRNCAAIGTYQPTPGSKPQLIAEHWNGSAWHLTPIPAP